MLSTAIALYWLLRWRWKNGKKYVKPLILWPQRMKYQFVATSSSTTTINTITLKEDESHSLLASSSSDKSILVTDVSNSIYSTVGKLNGHKGEVTHIAYSPVNAGVVKRSLKG
jgi:WD40 repeat protein